MQSVNLLNTARTAAARFWLVSPALRDSQQPKLNLNAYRRWILLLTSNLASAALTFAMQAAIARLLGLRGYGHYVYAISIAQAVTSVSVGGMEAISLRFVAQYKSAGDFARVNTFVRYGLRYVLMRGALGGAALLAITFLLSNKLDADLQACLFCAALLVPVTAALPLATNILVSLGDPFQVAFASGTLALSVACISATLAALGLTWHPAAIVTLQVGASLLVVLIQSWAIRRHLPRSHSVITSKVEAREWRSAAADVTVITLLGILQNMGGVIISGALLSTDQAALLVTASRFAALTLYGNTAVNQIVSPRFSALYSSGNLIELQRVVRFAACASTLFTFAVALPLVVVGPWLLGQFGAEFSSCYPVLLILLVASLINGAGGSTGSLMYMTGNQRASVKFYAISTICGVALSLVLVPIIGVYGVGSALIASSLVWNVCIMTYVKRVVGVWSGVGPRRWGLDPSRSAVAGDVPSWPSQEAA